MRVAARLPAPVAGRACLRGLCAQPGHGRRLRVPRSSPSSTRSRRATSGRSSTRSRPRPSIQYGPAATTASVDGLVRLQLRRPARDHRVLARRCGLQRVRDADASSRTCRSAPPPRGARGRPGRQRRPDAGRLHGGRSSRAPNTPVGTNVTSTLPAAGTARDATVTFLEVEVAGSDDAGADGRRPAAARLATCTPAASYFDFNTHRRRRAGQPLHPVRARRVRRRDGPDPACSTGRSGSTSRR